MVRRIIVALVSGALLGAAAVQAKLPAAPPKSDAEKAVDAEKAAAAKAKDAELLNKYTDKAVANYKKGKGIAESSASPASTSGKK